MDKMQQWELIDFTNVVEYSNASSWEQTRSIMYIIAQVNSKKKLSIKDIMHLPWDNNGASHNKEISNEDINRLELMAQRISKNMKTQ